jgi:hypothetical protein
MVGRVVCEKLWFASTANGGQSRPAIGHDDGHDTCDGLGWDFPPRKVPSLYPATPADE